MAANHKHFNLNYQKISHFPSKAENHMRVQNFTVCNIQIQKVYPQQFYLPWSHFTFIIVADFAVLYHYYDSFSSVQIHIILETKMMSPGQKCQLWHQNTLSLMLSMKSSLSPCVWCQWILTEQSKIEIESYLSFLRICT